MRKQNRPNQTANRRELLDEALAVSPTTANEPAPPESPILESASSVVDSTPVPTLPVENPVSYVTPPPLQRVPYDAPPCRLANIRAVTESMNTAAIPSQPHHAHPSEPMSVDDNEFDDIHQTWAIIRRIVESRDKKIEKLLDELKKKDDLIRKLTDENADLRGKYQHHS
ncbi:hypothetical protein CAEBREN_14666 [Caenorhabditis brenneri]|uniref:Uncharacterized protein n=1 Tax=Caenorhabditis brenneri TaxID=135651 RepID=G0N5H1_CAEBE|nr:hypothetical protein CAEBREN_14666 [Caenorhabditis brenneri]